MDAKLWVRKWARRILRTHPALNERSLTSEERKKAMNPTLRRTAIILGTTVTAGIIILSIRAPSPPLGVDDFPSSTEAAESNPARNPSPSITIPKKYKLVAESVPRVESDADLLTMYTEDQREFLEAFYNRYGTGPWSASPKAFRNILSFHTAEQLQWLVEQGFPMPGDVLTAAAWSDDELRGQAEAGNFKARIFYAERLTQRELELLQSGSSREAAKVAVEAMALERTMLGDGSVFSAYVLAKRATAKGKDGHALAAYSYAEMLGDSRAPWFAAHYAAVAGSVPAGDALSAFKLIMTEGARRNPGLANMTAIKSRQSFPRSD
jgi:hypothetical protein